MKRFAGMLLLVVYWVGPSAAATLDPLAFAPLGTLVATAPLSINTDTLEMTGGTSYLGVLDPNTGYAVFTFDEMTTGSISIFGTRSLGLLSRSNMTFTGPIDVLKSGNVEIAAPGTILLTSINMPYAGTSLSIWRNLDLNNRPGPQPLPIRFEGDPPILAPLGEIIIVATRDLPAVPIPPTALLFASGLGILALTLGRTGRSRRRLGVRSCNHTFLGT